MSNILDCPALRKRCHPYPFGNRVPSLVRMRKTVMQEGFLALSARQSGLMPLIAVIGAQLNVWTNSYGAVAAVFEDGRKLALKPDEFDVIKWHELEKSVDE